jgi:hypothetical protein
MFFRIGPVRRTRIVAHREVNAIFGNRIASLPLNFPTRAPLQGRHEGVFAGRLPNCIKAFAMEHPSIATHPRVPLFPSTPFAIAASPAFIPVLRLGYFLGLMRHRGDTKHGVQCETQIQGSDLWKLMR